MKFILIIWIFVINLLATEIYWYNDNIKTKLYNVGYSDTYNSVIYSHSQNSKARKMVLTNSLIVSFNKNISNEQTVKIETIYNLKFIKKIEIGNGFYMFALKDDNSDILSISNQIFENEENIKYSYPDWMYLY